MKAQKLKVAFQGEHGAYSEIAAGRFFPGALLIPVKQFYEIFDLLAGLEIDAAAVPVENSIEGSINEIYDLLLDSKMKVTGEIFQRINHCLIANVQREKLTKVYSHPQAIAQCRNYLRIKGLDPIPTYDTAAAVRMIKEKHFVDAGAIGSKRAAQIYDMRIIDEGIQDRENNYTRFLILSNLETAPSGEDRTSLIFGLKHSPGALFNVLKEFANSNINLTKIESRPTKEKPWEYNFYVDIEGHATQDNIKSVLLKIKGKCTFFKVIGSYKKGIVNQSSDF